MVHKGFATIQGLHFLLMSLRKNTIMGEAIRMQRRIGLYVDGRGILQFEELLKLHSMELNSSK
jgi:hypothetical protein